MRKCKTCGKRIRQGKYCRACFEFHKHHYSKDELALLLHEYERSSQ